MVQHAAPPAKARARRGSAVVPATKEQAEKEERAAQRMRARANSVKYGWIAVTRLEPHLVPDAIRMGLRSTSPTARLGYLELGAKVMKEIGTQAEQAGGVQVIVVGPAAVAIEAWRKAAAEIAATGEGVA